VLMATQRWQYGDMRSAPGPSCAVAARLNSKALRPCSCSASAVSVRTLYRHVLCARRP
jgi:hypothetical protein